MAIPQHNSPPADASLPEALSWDLGVLVAWLQKYGVDFRDTAKLLRGVPVTTAGGTGPGRTVADAFNDLNSIAQSLASIAVDYRSIANHYRTLKGENAL